MSASTDLQKAIVPLLEASEVITAAKVPVILRKPKSFMSDLEAAVASFGICIYTMPPRPTHFLQGSKIIFFDKVDARVRVLEFPEMNATGVDAYDLIDEIGLTLHWSNPGGMLAVPMQLSARPTEEVEDKEKRIIDVIFEAQYQINPYPA